MANAGIGKRPIPDRRPAALAAESLPAPADRILAPARLRESLRDRLIALDRSLWPLAIVLGSYLVAAILLPTMAPVGISDDWTYARSVEYLVNDGQFHILPVAAATQIFQLFWGAAFAFVFGTTFGVLRVSTIVLIFISGVAFYGICRELRVGRARSALGTATYLFNPILFPITYSFMSDPHFLGLLVISTYCYVRGVRPGQTGRGALLGGSAIAALACLQRPHGALIPLGVVSYLVLSRRLRIDRRSAVTFAEIVAIPATVFLAYYLVIARGLPSQQGLFLSEIRSAGIGETWLLLRRLTVIEMVYIGLFVFPIVVAVAGSAWRLFDLPSRTAWLVFFVWEGVLIAGVTWFWADNRLMPYIPHFLGRAGPGSGDLRNARPPLASPVAFEWATVAFAATSLLFGLIMARSVRRETLAARPGAGVVLGIAAWQVVGVVPQSFLFRNWIISLDRYLLPLLPGAVVLVLWALDRWPLRQEIAWTLVAAVALFSAAGTRDVLVFQSDVWSLANQLNQRGVPNTRIDAGYAWDAYHLWEFQDKFDIPAQTPDGTWWTDVYARPTDSTYVIAGGPLPGYQILSAHPYSSWLQRDPVALYVLRRENAAPDGVVWP